MTSDARPEGGVWMQPIGVVRSPYKERFGTPRQATVTQGATGEGPQEAEIVLDPTRVPATVLEGLAGFDYVWAIVWLHLNEGWRPMVTPTRGPKVKRGLFSTRSPHRPNPIGLSALRVVAVEGHVVRVCGLDLLDGTPVLDLKPYVPYADAFPNARAGWLDALDAPMDEPDRPTRIPPRRLRSTPADGSVGPPVLNEKSEGDLRKS
jgi:tRNA-Thr(GGU) m(6)t(6)A37 methyltransferase TsaA